MTAETKPLAAPKDNLLGICNALGSDFGFNPLWLRLALGLVVLAARLAFPNARTHNAPVSDRAEAQHHVAANEVGRLDLAEAA